MSTSISAAHVASDLVFLAPAVSIDTDVLTLLAEQAHARGYVRADYAEALLARERRYPTGLPAVTPAAIPHADAVSVIKPGIGIALLDKGIEFSEMGSPGKTVTVELVLLLLVTDPTQQSALLSKVIAMLQREGLLAELRAAPDAAALARCVDAALA